MKQYKKNIQLVCTIILLFACKFIWGQDSITDPKINKVLSVVESVIMENNFIDGFSPDSNIALPLGIRRQIGAARYVVAVDSCKFKPAGAYFNAYAAIEFPGSTKKIAFAATNIKFNPKGVVGGSQSRLMLVSEHSIRISNLVTLKLLDDGNNWVEWDCNGYKAINLKGHFIFNKEKLVPDSAQTKDTVVTASFEIYTTDLHEFITKINITPFAIKDLKEWTFNVTNATVDMSELSNSPIMTFPQGYTNPNMLTQQMWTGFYLESVKVKLPGEISKEGKRTELLAQSLLIDNMGVTGLFQVNNLMTLDEGTMSGWDYSIDELGVGFLCNKLNSGHLKGKLNIPIIDSVQSLAYYASICYNPQIKEADYTFLINPANNLSFPVFSAKVNLNNNSVITVKKSGKMFKPSAILNGYISFNHKNLNSNGGQLQFQNLTIISDKPYVTQGFFTLHNINGNQTKAGNYPASVNDIGFGFKKGTPIMTFSVSINMMDNVNGGFSAGTAFSLLGKIDEKPVAYTDEVPVAYTKTKWKFEKLTVSGISLGVKTAVFDMSGIVLFQENDPVYGDGFFGKITFSIKNVLPTPATVSARFGALSGYRYFYVDAAIPTKIPLGSTPITISKIMGGMYYHMQPLKATKNELIQLSKTQPSTPSNALSYTPDPNFNVGFKAGVGFIYSTNTKMANGDVMLEVAFTQAGGLGYVSLSGDIYFMAEPTEQSKAPVKGSVDISYDVPNKVFHTKAQVLIDANSSTILGSAEASVHFEPAYWYACIGKPSVRATVNINGLAGVQAYFMVGSKIEPAPVPTNAAQTATYGTRNETDLQSGSGFCAGASFYAHTSNQYGFDFFNVYYSLGCTMGFDMMMIDYGTDGYCAGDVNSKIGLNGKLAAGGLYAMLNGIVGVRGEVGWLPDKWNDFDFVILSVGATAIAAGKLPKPKFFNGYLACTYNILGIVKGNMNSEYRYGQDCTPVKN